MGSVIAGQNTAVLESISQRYDRTLQLCCLSTHCLMKTWEVTERFTSSVSLAAQTSCCNFLSNLTQFQSHSYRKWRNSRENPPVQQSNYENQFIFKANIWGLIKLFAFLSRDGQRLLCVCQSFCSPWPEQGWSKTIQLDFPSRFGWQTLPSCQCFLPDLSTN